MTKPESKDTPEDFSVSRTLPVPRGRTAQDESGFPDSGDGMRSESLGRSSAPPSSSPARDLWFVTDGVSAAGPMPFDAVLRAQAEQRFSPGAVVRHESWQAWRSLSTLRELGAGDRQRIVLELKLASEDLYRRARRPESIAPPPDPRFDTEPQLPQRDSILRRLQGPTVNPVSVLSDALDFDEAMLLTLSTSVTAASADIGLLHRVLGQGQLVVTESVYGPPAEGMLGERFASDDPTLAVAARGLTVVGEPKLGTVGKHIAGRLRRCQPGIEGVAMVPLFLFGEVRALFEFGRLFRPFRARDIARAEDVIEVLAERAVVSGWVQ